MTVELPYQKHLLDVWSTLSPPLRSVQNPRLGVQPQPQAHTPAMAGVVQATLLRLGPPLCAALDVDAQSP